VQTLVGPILTIGGFGLYMLTTSRGRFRRIPWEFLALSGVGAALSIARVFADPGAGAILAAAASSGFLGFMCWLFLVKSMYARREDRPRVGDRFPAFRLARSDGGDCESASLRGRPHLVIFYRGSW
jgi:hypothetical protein